jgi:rubredoxin
MELGNQFGYLCPKCKQGDKLSVVVQAWAKMLPDGTDADGDQEWDENSGASCGCGWEGKIRDLTKLPDEDEERPMYECQNCGLELRRNQCSEARDISQRIDPGEIYTDKECPSCGALMFPQDE